MWQDFWDRQNVQSWNIFLFHWGPRAAAYANAVAEAQDDEASLWPRFAFSTIQKKVERNWEMDEIGIVESTVMYLFYFTSTSFNIDSKGY